MKQNNSTELTVLCHKEMLRNVGTGFLMYCETESAQLSVANLCVFSAMPQVGFPTASPRKSAENPDLGSVGVWEGMAQELCYSASFLD